MSVTTCAVIENRFNPDKIGTLTDRLNANSRLATCMREFDTAVRTDCPQLRADQHTKPWEFRETEGWIVDGGWDAGCRGQCDGPFGTLRVFEHLAELSWYFCRWSVFLTESRFRSPLCEATRLVSGVLNGEASSVAVFLPESSHKESLALDELNRPMAELLPWMREKFGAPAESLESIAQEPFEGYFVTRFLKDGNGIQPGASPNGGPATRFRDSAAGGGPPSVS